jgi:hypothetical protein
MRRVRVGERLTLALGLLLGCPSEDHQAFVNGTVLDDAGNAVRPTRVVISVDGAPAEECTTYFGRFQCPRASGPSYTLTLERGDEVYTETVSRQDDCGEACMSFRPFTVTTAPDGACSPDTLPLVARLVSPNPGTLGAIEQVWMRGQADIDQTVLPADAVGEMTWVGRPDAYVQEIFIEPGLPATEPLGVNVDVRANGTWCRAFGGWSGGMRLDGVALVAFLPKPGAAPCSYDPVELRVEPNDLIECFNISD